MIGCTMPWALMDSASAAIDSGSKRVRGCRGLGRTWVISSSTRETWPAGNSATSAARPRPNPRFLATLDHLQRHAVVRIGARRARIVPGDRYTVAWRLGQPDAPRHHRVEHQRPEVLALSAGAIPCLMPSRVVP